jgi:hypothetical protein
VLLIKVDTIYCIYLLTYPQKGKYMRFDFDAYEKVFPTAPPAPVQDTAVPPAPVQDTAVPPENDIKATDDKPGDDKATPEPEEAPPANKQIVTTEELPGNAGEGA